MRDFTRTVSWGLFGLSTLFVTPMAYILFDDFICNHEIINKEKDLDSNNDRIIKVLAKNNIEDSYKFNVTQEDMICGGLTEEESRVIYTLGIILDDISNEQVIKYLNIPKDNYRAETIRRLLPGLIGEYIKYGVRPGNSLTEVLMNLELHKGNNNKIDCNSNNPYELPIDYNTTQYWDGDYIKLKDGRLIRKYTSLWNSSLDHGLNLSKLNLANINDPKEYAQNVCRLSDVNDRKKYCKDFENIFKENNLDKLDKLASSVSSRLQRNQSFIDCSGRQINEGEWKPQTSEVFGYFINPKNVTLNNKTCPVIYKSFSSTIAWEFSVNKLSNVISPKSGIVTKVDTKNKSISVEHKDGMITTYTGLENINVSKNCKVSQGDKIGSVSRNLRFELIRRDPKGKLKSINPSMYYKGLNDSYSIMENSSFKAYNRVIDSIGHYDGTIKDISSYKESNICLVSNFNGNGNLDKIKPIYSKDNSWVEEFKVDLNSLNKSRMKILEEGTAHLGKQYVWAANGPDQFDCSGFTRWVYRKALGVNLPRHSAHQVESKYMEKIKLKEAKPGDLVFIPAGGRRSCNHIGIFIRDMNKDYIIMMHAPCKTDKLKVYKYPKANGLNYYRLIGIDQ